jgi:ribonuclease III
MNDAELLAAARHKLLEFVVRLVGPGDIPRFEEALAHPSFANETNKPDNQRLEFLGDAVLGLCVSEMLVTAHPMADEGKLTRMRSALVNGEALATWARRVDLGMCVALGRGAKLGSEREQTNVLADASEALVAAVYEARGLAGARLLVRDLVSGLFDKADALAMLDPKSELQERVQAAGMSAPTYRLVDVRGAPHDQFFEVEAIVGDRAVARGEGRSKRLAERTAAMNALATLEASPNRAQFNDDSDGKQAGDDPVEDSSHPGASVASPAKACGQ